MGFYKKILMYVVLGSLFIIHEVKSNPESPPSPSPTITSPPPSSSSSTPPPPSTPPPSSTTPSPSTPPPSTPPPSPSAGTPTSPSSKSTLDPKAAETELGKIFDIITGSGSNKASDLFQIYTQYPNCADRIAIEKAFTQSKFNFDKSQSNEENQQSEDQQSKPSDEDKEKVRLFMATLLFGCEVATHYSYHLKTLVDKKDSVRGITGILVACSENEELHTALQTNFDERFANGEEKIQKIVEGATDVGDVKNICSELINRKRQKLLDNPDEKQAEEIANKLVKEEKDTDGWSNDRKILDENLIGLPLNQCQLVVEKFSKDGKNLAKVFEEDFKDDVDKLTAYTQLIQFISLKNTFFIQELHFGLQQKDFRYPMRVFGAIKQKADLQEIETMFQKNYKDIDLREKVKELSSSSNLEYVAAFFQEVLDQQWGTKSSSGTPTTATPSPLPSSSTTPSSPPTTPAPSTTPPPPSSKSPPSQTPTSPPP